MKKVPGPIFQAVENSFSTARSPLQVSLSCFNGERKGSNMYGRPLSFILFSFADWPHGQCNKANLYKVGFRWRVNRAETRFFLTGAHYRESWRHEPCGGGVSGCPPPENFQVWRLRKAIFSTCHEKCLRKIDLEPENGKKLQVTIIKITESKENNSIHRLDVSGRLVWLNRSRGAAAPLAPPPPPPR